jgi:hypothetical protein
MALLMKQQVKSVRNSLIVLVIKKRRADLLKNYFNLGFVYSDSLELMADQEQDASEDAEICKIPEESDFRQRFPRLPPKGQRIGADESKSDDPAVVFDRGGEHDVGWQTRWIIWDAIKLVLVSPCLDICPLYLLFPYFLPLVA